jgi:SAM-dependent methyltransferase
MDITAQEYRHLHDGNFEDNAFIADITAMNGAQPDHRAWNEFAALLSEGSVLEIGPGTGQVLAAARASGRAVAGVEASEAHRRFIRATWGIEEVFSTLEELPIGFLYDNVVMVNVIEHVYDVVGLMKELRGHLSKDARVFISTVNAKGVVGAIVGTYWAMFKERDHVSFPSLTSLQRLADGTGYRLNRQWSAELPFETPIGLMVALRDFVREQRAQRDAEPGSRFASSPTPTNGSGQARTRKKKLLGQFYRAARRLDATRHAFGAVGRAATVKGIFVPLA